MTGAARDATGQEEGLRARKRRETAERIAREALRLFEQHGYDATTLEGIAAAAGISPRTLYHYFATKDELLHYWSGRNGFMAELGSVIVDQGTQAGPFAAMRRALTSLIPDHETMQSIRVSRIFAATESLRGAKQTFYVELEQTIYAALRQGWPDAGLACELRTVAMIAAGALRIAGEAQMADTKPGPLIDYVQRILDAAVKVTTLPSEAEPL